MQDPIVPFDLARMFLGDAPPLFFLEILCRTLIVYFYTLILLRWIGGRSVAQLSMVEFLLVIALGSAVGDAPFYPDVPLLHALAVITVVVLINKIIDQAIIRFTPAKQLLDGGPVQIVQSGRVLHRETGRFDMGAAEVFSVLRREGVRNLGEVEVAYFEPGGRLSIFRYDQPQSGLRIVPPLELSPPARLPRPRAAERVCCTNCGAVCAGPELPGDLHCPYCEHDIWCEPKPPRS
jgi:uncharacterized membrane protein YcaP (DUF421 family)|tara:strand:- start:2247 stop:2951 length:705 start_codon:yes stop_codon:yes gene_type:complete